MSDVTSNPTSKATLFIIFLLSCLSSFTQDFMSVGPAISSGSKTFPVNGRLGIGGSLEYIRNLSTYGGVRISIAYDYFKHRYPKNDSEDSLRRLEYDGLGTNILLPVRVGYQYYLYKQVSFLYAEAGMSVLYKPTYRSLSNVTKSLFTYAVGIGQKFKIDEVKVIQLSMIYSYNRLYENYNLNYFSLRAAYGFDFNRKKNSSTR